MNIPEYIDASLWKDFVEGRQEMQTKSRIPFTAVAQKRILARLEKFHEQGIDVNACLEESICNCWRSVFPPKCALPQVNKQQAQEIRNQQGALDWAMGGMDARH